MTDELDPQTQQHIDDSADVTADADAVACDDIDLDGPFLDESATAETPGAEDADEQNDDAPAQDDRPVQDAAPQAAGPIEVSSEEELDAVMDSMMDAVKAMKDAVADADVDAEEEEAAEAASTFVPGETPVADQGSTMPSFLQLEHPTIGTDAVDPHAAGFSVIEGGTGNIAVPQTADADAADTARPTAPHSPAASRDLGTAVSNTANAVGTFIAQGASAMREMNAAKKALADARAHLAELEQRIADQAEVRRYVDTLNGACFSLGCTMTRLSARVGVYLLAPAATTGSSPTSARRLPRPKRLQRSPRLTVMSTPPKRQSSRVSSNK